MMRKLAFALAVCLAPTLASASASPEVTFYNAAKVSLSEFDVPVGVRAVGMGEAYTAAGRDVYALNYNPAGLARLSGFQLALMHNEWSSALGLRQEYLAYGQGVGNASGLALAINYFSLGTLQERSSTGALGGESGAYALAGILGYASSLLDNDRLKLGLMAEYGTESLFKTSQTGFGAGLGLLYDFTRSVSLGIAVRHLGSGPGGFSPPSSADLGLSADFGERRFVTALDATFPFNGDPTVRAGVEANFGSLAVRGGWRQAFGAPAGDVSSGFTAGAGFKAGVFALDYAYVPYGELSSTHRVAANIELPADFFKPKVIGAEGTTTSAKRYFDKAAGLEKGGDALLALVEYQKVVDAYPEKMKPPKGKPQNFYLTAERKVKELKAELNKKGSNEQVRKLVAQALSQGQEYMKARRYRDAIEKFQEALSMENENKEAKKGLAEASAARGSRLGVLVKEGNDAFREGKIGTAIEKFREVVSLNPSNKDAEAFFGTKRAAIVDYLKKVHRKGIDFYVAGKIQEAITAWKGGQRMDPEDRYGVNFKRDIDKAQKLLDLRGGR